MDVAGEVWVYLDDDDEKGSANAADSSADNDNESDEVNDSRTIEGNYTQGNFCSSSRVNNTLDLGYNETTSKRR